MDSWPEIESYINKQRMSAVHEIGGHAIDPEDVLQVVRINVWKATQSGYDPNTIRSYIQTAIKNSVIDMKRNIHMRKNVNVTWTDSDKNVELDHAYGSSSNFESYTVEPAGTKEIDELEASMMLDWLTCGMSERYADIVAAEVEGVKQKDAAKMRGMTVIAYKNILHRARRKIKKRWDTLKTN